jgi:hypothetical protein
MDVVDGRIDMVEALRPNKMQPNHFCQFSISKKIFHSSDLWWSNSITQSYHNTLQLASVSIQSAHEGDIGNSGTCAAISATVVVS